MDSRHKYKTEAIKLTGKNSENYCDWQANFSKITQRHDPKKEKN